MADVDQEWTIIRQQLSDPRWDFRTIDGLSRATGLAPERVANLIDEHSNEVRISNVPDVKGRRLYTLAERSMKFRELLANTMAFITKTVP